MGEFQQSCRELQKGVRRLVKKREKEGNHGGTDRRRNYAFNGELDAGHEIILRTTS
jgi:hypothetical protein